MLVCARVCIFCTLILSSLMLSISVAAYESEFSSVPSIANSSRMIDPMILHARCISFMKVEVLLLHSVSVNKFSLTMGLLMSMGNVFMTFEVNDINLSRIGSVRPNPPLPLGRNVRKLMARSG